MAQLDGPGQYATRRPDSCHAVSPTGLGDRQTRAELQHIGVTGRHVRNGRTLATDGAIESSASAVCRSLERCPKMPRSTAPKQARMTETTYIENFSAVPNDRYAQAQAAERGYWDSEGSELLIWQAQCRFYAGRYEWEKHRDLINPFRIDPGRPGNFQCSPEQFAGAVVLDVGCGPISQSLSLIHCATVHAVDPLIDHYRELQPFGWEYFRSAVASGAEELPFEDQSIDVVHCRNVLDHTRNADQVLSEIARVLRPGGRLLLNCDLRNQRGGGPGHPYNWCRKVLEQRVFAQFVPVRPATVVDVVHHRETTEQEHPIQVHWICHLRRG